MQLSQAVEADASAADMELASCIESLQADPTPSDAALEAMIHPTADPVYLNPLTGIIQPYGTPHVMRLDWISTTKVHKLVCCHAGKAIYGDMQVEMILGCVRICLVLRSCC